MKENGTPRVLPRRRTGWSGYFAGGRWRLLRECIAFCAAGFLLSGARLSGQMTPLAACLAAALPSGLRTLSAAAGAAGGYLLFGQGAECAELVAMTVLMLASSAVFQGTELSARKWFFPAIAGSVAAVLGAVFFFSSPGVQQLYALARKTLLSAFGTLCFRGAAQGDRRGKLFFAAALVSGLGGMALPVNPGLLSAAALTLCVPETAAVTAFGIALDLGGGGTGCACAALLLPALLWRIARVRRDSLRAGTGILLTGVVTAFCGGGSGANLLGIVIGYVLGWLLL